MGQAALKLVEHERLNISQLAEEFDLDRASVRKRIQEAGIEPVETKAKLTIYELNQRLAAILSDVKSPMNEARLRKETAAAEKIEMQNAIARGELVQMGDAIERMQAILTAMYKEFGIHQPKRLASRLAKAKTVAEISKILKGDNDKIFARLREKDGEFVPVMKK